MKIPKLFWNALNVNTQHMEALLHTEQKQFEENNTKYITLEHQLDEICRRLEEEYEWTTEEINSEFDASWFIANASNPLQSSQILPVSFYLRKQAVYSLQEIAKTMPETKTMMVSKSIWRITVKRIRANIKRINYIRHFSAQVASDVKAKTKQVEHMLEKLNAEEEDANQVIVL